MTTAATFPMRTVALQALGRDLNLEYYEIAPERTEAPLVVFLHEGLGSATMWRDWPAQLCEAAGCRGLVFSRYGYGGSTPRPADEKWGVEYMHDQAREALPAFLDALGLQHERPVFYGHSDGGSIALLYAAMYPERVRALMLAAPHIFVEDVTVASIAQAKQAYLQTDLPARLGRYHQDADLTFWAWNDIWLNPAFKAWNIESELSKIHCPILAIQGADDEYGSLEQIRGIQRIATQTQLCIIDRCRHSPHKDQPEILNTRIVEFLQELA